MRMVKVDDALPESLIAIQDAARAGDLDAMREHWEVFLAGFDAFREAFERL
jgi:hypothetical protein